MTFTEFAASELLIRVREFVGALTGGEIPTPLRVALPDGLSEEQHLHLSAASEALDEITCSTIHGFCQRLISPYPVEADIDPGATVMDRDQADLAFREIADAWLREELSGDGADCLRNWSFRIRMRRSRLIRTVIEHYRRHRDIAHAAPEDLASLAEAFRKAVAGFNAFVIDTEVEEPIPLYGRDASGNWPKRSAPSCRPRHTLRSSDFWLPRLIRSLHPGRQVRKYQKKTKWRAAARQAGFSQADSDRLNTDADTHYARCCEAGPHCGSQPPCGCLPDLVQIVRPVMDSFREHKRSTAQLDFDDLIFAARDLLRDFDEVRRALARQFTHVLVDEFQDTDPLQTEIFWRLCGEPPADGDTGDWTSFALRPGALFLVGDPKQAIYRFRGADIAAYIRAREAFRSQAPDGVLSISTNFRSCAPIMAYVNERFEYPLSEENGQRASRPSFPSSPRVPEARLSLPWTSRQQTRWTGPKSNSYGTGKPPPWLPCVHALSAASPFAIRGAVKCGPAGRGDIALLAPTGTELWRYEETLERHGVPVATQAGKGLFRRQEVQDLIAITRVLADRRDTLALGALLRGPLVGLTEEELLDIVGPCRARECTARTPAARPRCGAGGHCASLRQRHRREAPDVAAQGERDDAA